MSNPKLRRVFALTALIAALSMLPAQAAAGFAPREPRRAGFAEKFDSWRMSAWSFLTGFFDKARSNMNPDGFQANSASDSGH